MVPRDFIQEVECMSTRCRCAIRFMTFSWLRHNGTCPLSLLDLMSHRTHGTSDALWRNFRLFPRRCPSVCNNYRWHRCLPFLKSLRTFGIKKAFFRRYISGLISISVRLSILQICVGHCRLSSSLPKSLNTTAFHFKTVMHRPFNVSETAVFL